MRESAPGPGGDIGRLGPAYSAYVLPFLYYLAMTRVLLAEDDTSISEPLSRALRREGYEVDVTADGPTTLEDRKSTRLNSRHRH